MLTFCLHVTPAADNLECYCKPGVPTDVCDPLNPVGHCEPPHGFERNSFDPNVTAFDMRETYLAGWRAASKAGIQGAMCSTNAVNGIPLCAHEVLLNGIRTVICDTYNSAKRLDLIAAGSNRGWMIVAG